MGDQTPFEKWEGLGNDFVVVEGALPEPGEVRALCDRRRGVGADGVLVIEPAPGFAARMTVLNADGSRPEMCGNGLRCVAGWLAARGRAEPSTWVRVQTDAGPRSFRAEATPDGWSVAIRMGAATFQEDLVVLGTTFRQVNMGNPHAIAFGAYDAGDLDRLGPRVATTPAEGTNVELVRGEGRRLEVLVWERGVGPTQACGTGACAVAAIACRDGRSPFGEALEVVLPGGALRVVVEPGSFEVEMTGPARRTFSGHLAPRGAPRVDEVAP